MNFNPEKNFNTYEDNSTLQVRDIKLQAQSVIVYLKEEDLFTFQETLDIRRADYSQGLSDLSGVVCQGLILDSHSLVRLTGLNLDPLSRTSRKHRAFKI